MPQPTIQDLDYLQKILLKHPNIALGRAGINAMLNASDIPQQFIYSLTLTNNPTVDASHIIFSLRDIGTLANKPTHTGLGALAEYLLKTTPSLDDKIFLSFFLTYYELINDRGLLKNIAGEYHPFESYDQAEMTNDLGWKGRKLDPATIDQKNLESIVKPEVGFLDTIFLSEGAKASPAVCRIETMEHLPQPIGTGFLIAPDLILTNNHVIPIGIKIEDGVQARFNFRVEKNGKINQQSLPFKIVKLIASSSVDTLDFSLLQLEKKPNNIHPLSFAAETPRKQDLAVIVQHPAGAPQKFILDHSCIIAKAPQDTHPFLNYTTNTLNGSSGSPVFNTNWEIVALHRAGATLNKSTSFKSYNEGVQIQLIQEKIQGFI